MRDTPSIHGGWGLHNTCMLDLHAVKGKDINSLSSAELAELATRLLAHVDEQNRHIDEQGKHIAQQRQRIDSDAAAIKWRDAKIESITMQLARLKAWKFGAKTERMNAEQREIFEETLAADQASLEAQLAALQQPAAPGTGAPDKEPRRKPKREPLPPHLPRVDQRIEPQDTTCPTPACGQPMVRVGEDISERLDIVPAQFFVQRQIRGKWACRCCQVMVQEPAAPQVFDNALPTPGLQAHVMVSRFVDHIPYYRQEQINGRSHVYTPRSTLAGWGGQTGAQLLPLAQAHREFVLGSAVLHADETPISLLDPGAGKTKKAYMWAYSRGAFDPQPGVVFDFCPGRGGKYAQAFLGEWTGTLVVDAYGGYDALLSQHERKTAHCLAHARRKFDELFKSNASEVAARALSSEQRLEMRLERSQKQWEALHVWLRLERTRVPDGSAIAKAIDYSLNHWEGLSRFLLDGNVPVDNNHIENLIRPWALGRRNWLFVGSQLAGERAAAVMSLLQSARLYGHEPWAYLKDVLTRLPTQLNSRIVELLPHKWQPAS